MLKYPLLSTQESHTTSTTPYFTRHTEVTQRSQAKEDRRCATRYGFTFTGDGRKYSGARMQPLTSGPEADETKPEADETNTDFFFAFVVY